MEEKVIEEKIASDAYKKWPFGKEPENVEDAIAVTGDSEIAAVEGIVKALGLDEEVVAKLIGPKDEEGKYNKIGEIYSSSKISPEIATKIQEVMNSGDKNKSVLDILSTIHDAWVRKNPNNFLGTKGEIRYTKTQRISICST